MERCRFLGLVVGFALAACAVPADSAATTTFSDATFDLADYTLITTGSGIVTPQQVATGGNPGSFLDLGNNPATSSTVNGWHLNTMFVYDPSISGAIDSINWSVDALSINSQHFLSIAAEQDGTLYRAGGILTGGLGAGWQNHSEMGFVAADFGGLDFSSAGAPITFGFLSANTWNSGAPGFNHRVGYDNLTVSIVPVPEPNTGTLVGLGLLWIVSHSRRRAQGGVLA